MPTELIKFASVGPLNTAIGLIIIYTLKWYLYWDDASANFAGYLVCIALGFVLNGRWTFGKSVLNSMHLWGYLLVAITAYLLNLSAIMMSIAMLNIPGDYAQLVGVPVFTLTSYLLNKAFFFEQSANPLVKMGRQNSTY